MSTQGTRKRGVFGAFEGSGFTKKSKLAKYIGADVLLTDSIYPDGPPAEAVGHHFHYIVMRLTTNENVADDEAKYALRYENKMIHSQGATWISYEVSQGQRGEIVDISYAEVREGQQRYLNAVGRISRHNREERERVEANIKAASLKTEEEEVDMSDIQKIFDNDTKGGKSNKVMELEFELTGEEKHVDDNKKHSREWKHKQSGKTFWQGKSGNKKTSWNTGVWTKKLHNFAKGGEGVSRASVERAKFILAYRRSSDDVPTKGMGFFDFEEDLSHHINECFIIISTGLPMGFFCSPHVQDLLRGLEPRHKPLYPLKLMRLLRVVILTLNEEISLIIQELFLKYCTGFVASSSDFWWHPVYQLSFGGCIASVIANRYRMQNGLSLFMSDSTHNLIKGDTSILQSAGTEAILDRCKMLLDFVQFDEDKTGKNIGDWLLDIHSALKIKPSYIGSQVVDGAGISSIDALKFNVQGETPREMIAEKCDPHQANITGKKASGTSTHKVNLNPDLGESLKKLHTTLVRVTRSGTRKKVLDNVRQEKGRSKYPRLTSGVLTRWNSDHEESKNATANQSDFEVALDRMLCKGGVDEDLWKAHKDDLDGVKPNFYDYSLYAQYEAALKPLRTFSEFSQSQGVIIHYELIRSMVCLEELKSSYFAMSENVSAIMPPVADLTKRPLNTFVGIPRFQLTDSDKRNSYLLHTTMLEEIRQAKRVAYRELAMRLGYRSAKLCRHGPRRRSLGGSRGRTITPTDEDPRSSC